MNRGVPYKAGDEIRIKALWGKAHARKVERKRHLFEETVRNGEDPIRRLTRLEVLNQRIADIAEGVSKESVMSQFVSFVPPENNVVEVSVLARLALRRVG